MANVKFALSTAANTFLASSPVTLGRDENSTGPDLNDTMSGEGTDFIFSGLAFAISGVFVWTALLLTCFQVRVYLVFV